MENNDKNYLNEMDFEENYIDPNDIYRQQRLETKFNIISKLKK